MSFLRRGERRRGKVAAALTTVGALAAFQALSIVGAGVASAVTNCTYNPATDTINITIDPNDAAAVMVETAAADEDPLAAPGSILFDAGNTGTFLACGSASNTNTVSIVVLGQPSNAEEFVIDEATGDPFNTAIVWNIDLGTGAGDFLTFDLNCDQNNTVALTNTSFNLNGALGEVLGGSAGDEWNVIGCDGNDVVDASAVTAVFTDLSGGLGDDVLSPGTFAGDFLTGGGGTDTLSYSTRTTATAIVNGVQAGTDANGDGDSADVGDEGDLLFDCFEVLQTGTGADTIIANGDGCGGTSVTAVPGDGDDHIVGDAGNDWIDWSSSSAGMAIDIPTETAVGQGTDTWDVIARFVGSPFDDTMTVAGNAPGPGVAEFFGGDGVDTVDGSAAAAGVFINLDILDPSGADDLENVVGSAFNDNLHGNDNPNQITAGAGNDGLDGQPGDDTMNGGPGNNTYFGDSGRDTVTFADTPAGPNGKVGVVVDLSQLFATHNDGSDSFTDPIETIIGSAFNDTITGGPNLAGGTLNYTFKGTAGNDILTGFSGNDTLNGAGGRDTVRGVGGDDTLKGGAQNDTLSGGGGFDIGKGGNGQDVCSSVEQRSSCGTKGNPASPQAVAHRQV